MLPKNKKNLQNVKGFTLIELLVVVSIISILVVIGFVTYRGVQQGARDTKRRSEVDSITKALEIRYQVTSGGTCDGGGSPNGGTYCPLQAAWFASNVVPTDANAAIPYCIWYNTTGAIATTPAAWNTTTCTAIAGSPAANVAVGVPAVNAASYWKVCAVMEKDSTVVYCVNSKQ